MGIRLQDVHVSIGAVGGGFGAKQLRAGPIAAMAALAASKVKRPVKLALTRAQDMAFCPGAARSGVGCCRRARVHALCAVMMGRTSSRRAPIRAYRPCDNIHGQTHPRKSDFL